jgi:hypothetical protein
MDFTSGIKAGCANGTQEWTDGRKNTIGASEINGLLFGLGPFCSKRKIAIFKKALGMASSTEKYLRFSLGHFFEEVTRSYVLYLFANYGEFIEEEKRYTHEDFKHYSCTPDFVGKIKTDRLKQVFADTYIHEFLKDKDYQTIIFEFKYALSHTTVIDNALSHSYHKTYLPQMALEQIMFGKEIDFCIYARLNCSLLIPNKIVNNKLLIREQVTYLNGEFTTTKIANGGCILYFMQISREWIAANITYLRKLYPFVQNNTYADIYSLNASLFKKENMQNMLSILADIKNLFAPSYKIFDGDYDISQFLKTIDEFNDIPHLLIVVNDLTVKFDFMDTDRIKNQDVLKDSLVQLTDQIQSAKIDIKNALSKNIGKAYSELKQIFRKMKEIESGINLNEAIINHTVSDIEEKLD